VKRPALLLFFIVLQAGFLFSSEIGNYICPCSFMIFFPSAENLIDSSKLLFKKFYSRNYEQMMLQMSSDSKNSYGIDVFDLKSLEKAGFDLKSPVCFVHISNDSGYMLLPVKSKNDMTTFINNNLKGNAQFRFVGSFLALSRDKSLLNRVGAASIEKSPGFIISEKKLSFGWDKTLVWMESSYLSDVSSSIGVTANLKLPYGFTSFIVNITDQKISIKAYSGIIPTDQKLYIQNINNISFVEKNDLLDYIEGNPAVEGQIYLNLPVLYRYYTYIDSINILGLKGFIDELREKYMVNVERDLINNTDGRIKIVVDKFDTVNNEYVIYGSIGIRDPITADYFMDSLKNAILESDNQLFTFDLFTRPFYHFKNPNYSIFYGTIGNDLYFSTDKGVLTNLIKNIFENKTISADKLPDFFKEAKEKKSAGFYFTLDTQSLFNQVKTVMQFDPDLLIGVKNIYIYGTPDKGDRAFGWNCDLDFNYYQK